MHLISIELHPIKKMNINSSDKPVWKLTEVITQIQ